MGLIYLSTADPEAAKRTWQTVMYAAVEFFSEKSKARWKTATKDKAFDSLRRRILVDCQPK